MAVITKLDYSTGKLDQWQVTSDARPFPNDQRGRAYLLTVGGAKWSTVLSHDGYTARYSLAEAAGGALDPIGGKDGSYVGGPSRAQAGTIQEAGTASVLLNGSQYIDLGANGVDLSSGSWGIACLIRPSALGASHRGIIGGPTGSWYVSLLNGDVHVGIVGGGDLQFPAFARSANLNAWNLLALSYDANTQTLSRVLVYDGIGYNATYYEIPKGSLAPTPGVKVTRIGQRDATGGTGGFVGNMQELVIKKGDIVTEAMAMTLWEPDARTRTADRSPLIEPCSSAPANRRAMSRFDAFAALPNKPNDRAERTNLLHYKTDGFDTPPNGKVEYWSMAWYLPGDSNWQNQFTTSGRDLTIAQILGRNINAASVLVTIKPKGWQGLSTPAMVPFTWGGLCDANRNPLDRHTLDPAQGNGWNTFFAPGGSRQDQRGYQIIGPNTMLAGNVPLLLEGWFEVIMRITCATDAFSGSLEWWIRRMGSGTAWTKVAQVGTGGSGPGAGGPARETVQWGTAFGSPAHADGTNDRVAFGAYAHIDLPLTVYHAGITRCTTFADAEAAFPAEGIPATPTITGTSPASGAVASSVQIIGTNLTGATAVFFNGISAPSVTVNSSTLITVTVPAGATTGLVQVTTPAGDALSPSAFTVTATAGPSLPDAAASHLRVGSSVEGSYSGGAVIDSKRVIKRNVGAGNTVSIDKAYALIAGPPSGGSGKVKALVYAADGAGGDPGTLLGVSDEATIAQGASSAWIPLTFSTPVTVVGGATGDVYIGVHYGGTGNVSFSSQPVTGGGWRGTDTYSDGASTPFGTPTVIAIEVAVVADYTTTADTIPPAFSDADVLGTLATLSFGEALDPGSVPATSAFALTVNSVPVAISNVTLAGADVLLTFSPQVNAGDTVAVSYTPPGSGKLRDAAANNVLAFVNLAVNNVATPIFGPRVVGSGARTLSPRSGGGIRRAGVGGGGG